ncbi:hypothetical protein BH11PSE13_BH11PSE13_41420 [soil metagenome]
MKPPRKHAPSGDADLESAVLGGMLTNPSLHCGAVVQAYGAPALKSWRAVTTTNVSDALDSMIERVQDGDLSELEAMLVSQAVALQSMFTTLAARAQGQTTRENINSLTTLALKAQGQSRATVLALVELKYPRTMVIAKQANIATNGAMQQVNNGAGPPPACAREDGPAVPNELIALENDDGRTVLDAGAACATSRDDQAAPSLVARDRARQRRGQGHQRP